MPLSARDTLAESGLREVIQEITGIKQEYHVLVIYTDSVVDPEVKIITADDVSIHKL